MRVPRPVLVALPLLVVAGVAFAVLRPRAVPVARLTRGDVVEAVYASGTLEAVERAEVRARVAGPLTDLFVREGQPVKKGQLLARIDVPALRYDVTRGRADATAARLRSEAAPQLRSLQAQAKGLESQREQAQADLERVQALVKQGVQPEQALERAHTLLEGLDSQLEANRAQQRDMEILLRADAARSEAGAAALTARAADSEIRAPFDGVVLVRRVERGETVLGGQSLLRIGDPSRLQLEAWVDEADIARISLGIEAAARFLAWEDRALKARVIRIAPEANRERKAFAVDLELVEPPAGLRPGMTAELNLVSRRAAGALLAPLTSLGAATPPSLRVLRDGRVQVVPVRTGARDLMKVEVSGELSEGEPVVLGDVPVSAGERARGVEEGR